MRKLLLKCDYVSQQFHCNAINVLLYKRVAVASKTISSFFLATFHGVKRFNIPKSLNVIIAGCAARECS